MGASMDGASATPCLPWKLGSPRQPSTFERVLAQRSSWDAWLQLEVWALRWMDVVHSCTHTRTHSHTRTLTHWLINIYDAFAACTSLGIRTEHNLPVVHCSYICLEPNILNQRLQYSIGASRISKNLQSFNWWNFQLLKFSSLKCAQSFNLPV